MMFRMHATISTFHIHISLQFEEINDVSHVADVSKTLRINRHFFAFTLKVK